MCMEDIRIGRRSRSSYREISLADGVPVQVCGYDASRIAITFLCGSDVNYNIHPPGGADGDAGLRLSSFGTSWSARIEDAGNLVAEVWRAETRGANGVLGIIETTLGER
jgi:hypothetical protein